MIAQQERQIEPEIVSYPIVARPSVSVVIPALNEAENLPYVLPRIPMKWVDEVILVDGFSTDDTVEVARSYLPDIRVLMQEGRGKGAALRTGFEAASGKIVVMLDADGSTDPKEIPLFVGALMAGADFVKGSRFLQGGGTFDMPLYRAIGNFGLTQLTNLLFGTRYSDITYGYNAAWKYCRSAMAFEIDGWANEIVSNIRVARCGLLAVEVPCFEHSRVAGTAKLQTFSAGWTILKGIIRERMRPVRWTIWSNQDVIGDAEFIPAMQLLRSEALHLIESRELSPKARAAAIEVLRQSYEQILMLETEHEDAKRLQTKYKQATIEHASVWKLLKEGFQQEDGAANILPALAVSVIIRTYTEDRWDYLVQAIDSCLRQSLKPHEIIIVVDHNPALAEKIRRGWDHPSIRVVENTTQRGSSPAWNTGIEQATGDILAFLDDDAIAEKNWLQMLCQHYEHEDVMGVGGHIVPRWLSGRPGWFPDEFLWVVGCSYRGLPAKTAEVRNLIGCNMSFRRNIIEELDGFRVDLGHQGVRPSGNEETELCIRARQRWPQNRILHEPSAMVQHVVPPTRITWSYFRWRCSLEGTSKAMVSGMVGTNDGLSTEMNYTLKILPTGVLRGVWQAMIGDVTGLWRASAIVYGFSCTLASYVTGRITGRTHDKTFRTDPATIRQPAE